VIDSLNLDEASRTEYPHTPRWDYLLSFGTRGPVIAVEPHPADNGEVNVVIAKKRAARDLLVRECPRGCPVARWFWISTNAGGFSRMDKVRRRLDQNGIEFRSRKLLAL